MINMICNRFDLDDWHDVPSAFDVHIAISSAADISVFTFHFGQFAGVNSDGLHRNSRATRQYPGLFHDLLPILYDYCSNRVWRYLPHSYRTPHVVLFKRYSLSITTRIREIRRINLIFTNWMHQLVWISGFFRLSSSTWITVMGFHLWNHLRSD